MKIDRTQQNIMQYAAIKATKPDLAKYGRAIIVAATGAGKGEIIRKISETLTGTMLVVVPRVNLVKDLAERIGDCEIYCASLKSKKIGKITVGTLASLRKITMEADLVIIDEAHQYKEDVLEAMKCKFILGLTASPWRQDGYIYGEDKFWPKPSYLFPIEKCIDAGFLCDYKIYSTINKYKIKPSNAKREFTEKEILSIVKNGKAENQVQEIFEMTRDRKKIAIICSNIEHAEKIKAIIEEIESCSIIHSKLKSPLSSIDEYENTNIRYVVSVAMISEGYDYPPLDAIILLRPTRSARLMLQISGRGLRLSPGKENCLLIDFGDVFLTCGTPRDPILQFEQKPDSSSSIVMRECSKCLYVWGTIDSICPACGHDNKVVRDVEKSLSESLLDDDLHTIWLDKSNFIKASKTTRGARFCEYRINKESFHFFGGNYWKAIKRPDMLVTYRYRNNRPNVVKVDIL